MFDGVTKREGVKRAGRHGLFFLGSSGIQAASVAGVILCSAALHAREADGPLVPVVFAKAAASSMPPAPKPSASRTPRPSAPKPKAPAPTALVQPQEIPRALEDPAASADADDTEVGDGAEDGVIGGVVGGSEPTGPGGPSIEEAPAYASAGFTSPRQEEKGCVQRTLRIPRALAGFASSLTVKFAIGSDGSPSLFQVLPPAPDPRIGAAIWQSIRECRWIAGTDPQGKPARIWVIMPFRFQGG